MFFRGVPHGIFCAEAGLCEKPSRTDGNVLPPLFPPFHEEKPCCGTQASFCRIRNRGGCFACSFPRFFVERPFAEGKRRFFFSAMVGRSSVASVEGRKRGFREKACFPERNKMRKNAEGETECGLHPPSVERHFDGISVSVFADRPAKRRKKRDRMARSRILLRQAGFFRRFQ